MDQTIALNKIRGMLAGLTIGDALGAPHEFRYNRDVPYSGKLEHKPSFMSRFQDTRHSAIGQITDDSEMSITMIRSILRNNGYNKRDIILSYEEWANSTSMMGRNTKSLLKGVKTIPGYERRYNLALKGELKGTNQALPDIQSNGSLMRASPLALLFGYIYCDIDCDITNPNIVNREVNMCYVMAIKLAIMNHDPAEILSTLMEKCDVPEVLAVLIEVQNKEIRNVTIKKGWVLHSFYCAMTGFVNILHQVKTYSGVIDWVISLSGDTDTNAAITGALVGSYLGYNNMMQEEVTKNNFDIVLNCDTTKGDFPRADIYTIKDFDSLCFGLSRIGQI